MANRGSFRLKNFIRQFFKDDSGQTLVEFVLLLAISVSIIALLKNSIRSITTRLWEALAKRIAAACHDTQACAPGGEFNL
jgi:Flp pilus assembly pilin Flp